MCNYNRSWYHPQNFCKVHIKIYLIGLSDEPEGENNRNKINTEQYFEWIPTFAKSLCDFEI